MKQLFVLRHSKAGQTNKKILDDHERPLTQKGIDAAILVGDYMNDNGYVPQHIITSTAIRANQTAELVTKALKNTVNIEQSNKLYLSSSNDVFKRLARTDDNVDKLLIIGHNPGLQQFAIELSGKGDKKKFREMRSNFPPRSLAVFNLDIEKWSDINIQSGELTDFHIARAAKASAA